MVKCKTCGTGLSGMRRRFCSVRCKQADINQRLQSYAMQQERGRERKLHLIRLLGGACQKCGYGRNFAALAFHHRTTQAKSFQLDLRSLSNRTWQRIVEEAAKCELLCSNCHLEVHNPTCSLTEEAINEARSIRVRRGYRRRSTV